MVEEFHRRRYGYDPFGLPDTLDRWDLEEEVIEYSYLQTKFGKYLTINESTI